MAAAIVRNVNVACLAVPGIGPCSRPNSALEAHRGRQPNVPRIRAGAEPEVNRAIPTRPQRELAARDRWHHPIAASPITPTAEAAVVAAPAPSMAPAVSVAASAPPATAPTPPVATTAATVAAPRAAPLPISAPIPTRSAAPAPRVPVAIDAAIFGIIQDAKANSSMEMSVGNIWVIG